MKSGTESDRNLHPYSQILESKQADIVDAVKLQARLRSIPENVCREIFRVGYESAWDDALTTPNAARFSRLLDEQGSPVHTT